MLNYEVPPALLRPLVPKGTELDTWHGATLASVVGFRFIDTRVLGIPIPGHRDFDEVNLRFYVRRRGTVYRGRHLDRPTTAAIPEAVAQQAHAVLPLMEPAHGTHDRC